jgi:pyridoxal phosphate enzyme (YggS family)
VSKTKPVEAILHAYNVPVHPPQRHFGENYVQELLEKSASQDLNQDPASPDHVRWHFIGHLQSNKCKSIARIPNLALVESVDSVKLATELNKACESVGRSSRLPVLIQVNTSGESSKFGCAPDKAVDLFGHVMNACPKLQARGLMTIGRLADTPQPDCFDTLVNIREQIFAAFNGQADASAAVDSSASSSSASASASASAPSGVVIDPSTFEMSMGMSGDYELALARGATILRIGSTIFGAREYPQKEVKT